MGKKIIVFNAPASLMVFLGGVRKALDYLAIAGAGGVALESKFQFKPWATLIFLLARAFIGYVMNVYVTQTISDDEDK